MTSSIGERKIQNVTLSENGYGKSREFIVAGPTTPEAAIVATGSPDTLPEIGDDYGDLSLQCTNLEAKMFDDDNTRWIVTATYTATNREDSEGGSINVGALSNFQFQTGAESVKVFQAKTPTPAGKSFARTGTAPLSKGLIGWDGEKAQGADVPFGAFRFSISKKYARSEIDDDYILLLSSNVFSTNEEAWSSWNAGEILFEGASGRHAPGGKPVVYGDDNGQMGGFSNLTGVDSSNSSGGVLYTTLEKWSGLANYKVYFYQDSDRTDLVGSCTMARVADDNIFSAEGSSGISGTFTIYKYLYDSDTIAVQFPLEWEIKYDFAVSPNVISQEVGDITVTNKEGWERADVQYTPVEQTVDGNKRVIHEAAYVYLHKVFDSMDFGTLLISESEVIPS